MTSRFSKFATTTITIAVGAGFTSYILLGNWNIPIAKADNLPSLERKQCLLSRADNIKLLKSEIFDIVIIGGGITGAQCALDAASRGLNTALIEEEDFGSGTSGRSTKLVHGGVRYMEAAVWQFDKEQFNLVKECLAERMGLLNSAPHLAKPLPIMIPIYTYWQIPYFWMGMKMYDLLAWKRVLKPSYYVSKEEAIEAYPLLKTDKLKGAIVFYDGQLNDSRFNLSVALTAARFGATIVNHVSVIGLTKCVAEKEEKEVPSSPGSDLSDCAGKVENVSKDETCDDFETRVSGVKVKDHITGAIWDVKARCVINATGPAVDIVRKMDNPRAESICVPSRGAHITLPKYYSPEGMGLLDASTSDGRVVFLLPWLNHTLTGTTDIPTNLVSNPTASEVEVMFLLNELEDYLNPEVDIRRSDVLSAWSGIRPLVVDPTKPDTKSLSRTHIVLVSDTKLITIAGGKLTTSRQMAEDTIDVAIQECNLAPRTCDSQTQRIIVEGGDNWSPTLYIKLVQEYGLDPEVAKHLSETYGTNAFKVAKLAAPSGKPWPASGIKLHPDLPFIEAEVRFAIREYAMSAIDILGPRLRLAYLNVRAAQECLPRILDILEEELEWPSSEKEDQRAFAEEFLRANIDLREGGDETDDACPGEGGKGVLLEGVERIIGKELLQQVLYRFEIADKKGKGYISVNELRDVVKELGFETNPREINSILLNLNNKSNGQVRYDEYLHVVCTLKMGKEYLTRLEEKNKKLRKNIEKLKAKIHVERSGGGL